MDETLSFLDSTGRRIAATLAKPDGRCDRLAVLCHGFLSNRHSTTNKVLTALLLERGMATFRFDFMGQGDSDGPFEQISVGGAVDQALHALALVRSRGFTRLGLVGSSFGGLVALHAAARTSDLAALALKCPVPDFPEMLRQEFGQAGLDEWRRTGTIPNVTGGPGRVRLGYDFFLDCQRHVAYEAAKAVTAPTLIVQGDCDEYVPLHQAHRLFEALQAQKGLHILPGADHSFTRGADFRMMAGLLADWMVRHLLTGAAHAD